MFGTYIIFVSYDLRSKCRYRESARAKYFEEHTTVIMPALITLSPLIKNPTEESAAESRKPRELPNNDRNIQSIGD